MKTDSLFYRLFKELPSSFFELIELPSSQANIYQFESIELKQTAFRIDGVFLPQNQSTNVPIYFTEVQFQKDPYIYARLFSEIFLYLRNNDPTLLWQAVIVFRSRSIEPNARERQPYLPLLESPLVQRIYLNELEITETSPLGVRLIKLIVTTQKQIPQDVTQLVTQVRETVTDDKIKEQVINLIGTIVVYKLPQISRKELEEMLGLENIRQSRIAQELLAEGREEGREEGKLQAKLKTVPRLLERGFTVEEVAEILELEVEQVRQASQQ
ncbi:MAG: Rpn family recombination-promoting nuclease/putative transposase [Chroococcales cyanobacterium]